MQLRKKQMLALAVAAASLSLAAQTPTPAARGITAFNSGDYEQALTLFHEAEQAGNDSQSVDYNIAVSLYRLGQFEDAKQRFLELAGEANWEVLVSYNLGLVCEAQGELDCAREYFTASANQQEHAKIRQLAINKLNNLNTTRQVTDAVVVESRSGKSWAGLIEVAGGVDSNASSLADGLLDQSDRGEDNFSQAMLYGHFYPLGKPRDGLRLYGLAYAKAFESLGYLDSRVLGLGAVWEQPLWGWQSELGLALLGTELDGETVADQLEVRSSFSKHFPLGTLKFAATYADFSAGEAFQQIDGDRYRLELSWARRFSEVTTSLRYRHDWNNRADLSRGGGYASYSPIRSSIQGKLDWDISSKWEVFLEGEYIESSYRDRNRLRDLNGAVKEARRENRKVILSSGLAFRPAQNWKTELEYRLEESDDVFQLYNYDKNRVQASLQWQF